MFIVIIIIIIIRTLFQHFLPIFHVPFEKRVLLH